MLLYTALGDSITAGEGATSPALAYPNRLVNMLNQMRKTPRTVGEVLAEPGWTSGALENAVMANSAVYLTAAQAITIWVGGDDLASAAISILHGAPKRVLEQSMKIYGIHLKTLVKQIHSVSRAPIILCTQYNPFPNTVLASEAIRTLNSITYAVAGQSQARVAPAHEWFSGRQAELIAGYQNGRVEDVLKTGFAAVHPNNLGHQVIAEGLFPFIAPSA